jgi:DNA-binding transcriptional ArsR family regulator
VIRFRIPSTGVERLAFAYSPLFEAVLSLHVLVEPKHHPLQHDWVRRMRDLPDRLRRDIHAFAFAYRSYIPEVLAPAPTAGYGSFVDELARLQAQPPALVAFEFTVLLAPRGRGRDRDRLEDPAARAETLARADALGRESGRLVRLLLDDPGAFVDRFAQLLARYWDAGFAAEWQQVEPIIAAAVSEAGQVIANGGLYDYLPRLSPELLVDAAAQTVSLDREHEHEVVVDAATELTLTPSVYVWPHVRVNCDPPWPLALVYPAPSLAGQARAQLPPEDLLRVLRALADPGRLEMLRLIAARPRSTQELAQLVGMTEAGASRILRLLSHAGVVERRREGRYLLYRLVPDRLDLNGALVSFLARRRASGGRWR